MYERAAQRARRSRRRWPGRAGNGAGAAIARFSVAHQITGSAAWVAALVLMALADVLTRLVVIYLRGRRLAAGPAAPAAAVPAGARA